MRTPRARQERSPSAIRILRAALLSWVALRAVAAFVPGTWVWGLDSLRFSAPALGWSLWAAAALALVPSLARGLVPALSAAGDAIAAGGTSVRVAGALAAALLVVLLQDRTYFLGDALLRLGAANVLNDPGVLAPGGAGQVLPLDVLLHYQLPRAFVVAHLAAPIVVSRALGAVEAALFAVLSIELARALQLRGVTAAAVAAVSFFCGALLLFSGYDKSYTEMCVVTAAVGVCALRVARGDGGLVP